jgi:hypothetical protein
MSHPFFVRGSEAARRAGLTQGGTYICPLCEKGFDEAAYDERRLTLEHVPPKSQRGKGFCSPARGATTWRELLWMDSCTCARRWRNSPGHSRATGVAREMSVSFELGGVVVNATAHVDATNGSIELEIHEERNNPANIELQRAMTRVAAEGDTVPPITIRTGARMGYVERLAQLSELRAAYLLAFARFGYRYALNPRLDVVREQIQNHEREIIPYFCYPVAPGETSIMLTPQGDLLVRIGGTVVVLPWINGHSNVYFDLERRVGAGEHLASPCQKFEVPNGLEMDLDFAEE